MRGCADVFVDLRVSPPCVEEEALGSQDVFENCNLGVGFEVVETKLVLLFVESCLV